jgi:hypothetical protein
VRVRVGMRVRVVQRACASARAWVDMLRVARGTRTYGTRSGTLTRQRYHAHPHSYSHPHEATPHKHKHVHDEKAGMPTKRA